MRKNDNILGGKIVHFAICCDSLLILIVMTFHCDFVFEIQNSTDFPTFIPCLLGGGEEVDRERRRVRVGGFGEHNHHLQRSVGQGRAHLKEGSKSLQGKDGTTFLFMKIKQKEETQIHK